MTALLARWTEKLAGGPQAGRSDPPLARVMEVGRQQQQHQVPLNLVLMKFPLNVVLIRFPLNVVLIRFPLNVVLIRFPLNVMSIRFPLNVVLIRFH